MRPASARPPDGTCCRTLRHVSHGSPKIKSVVRILPVNTGYIRTTDGLRLFAGRLQRRKVPEGAWKRLIGGVTGRYARFGSDFGGAAQCSNFGGAGSILPRRAARRGVR